MNGKELLDKEVISIDGWKIGKTKEIILDKNTWQITHLDVELKGNIENDLGLDSVPLAHNHVPVAIAQVQGVGDIITLRTTKEELIPMLSSYVKSQKPVAQTSSTTLPSGGVVLPQ